MTTQRSRSREAGAVAVEFALVMPVLMLILLGIIDFGRVMYVKNSLTYATSQAARNASLHATSAGLSETDTVVSIISATAERMNLTGIAGGGGTVAVDQAALQLCAPDSYTTAPPSVVTVKASVPFRWITPANLFARSPSTDTITSTSTWLCVNTK